ncbi:MAG: type I methionyl aminopeptidase [Chloroflexota bacterium]
MAVVLKSDREIGLIRQGGRILAEVLQKLVERIRPGMNTAEIDRFVREEFDRRGVYPSFLGYRGFPAAVCVSVNEEIVHGIPGRRVLEEGDIVSIDLGVIYKGYQADAAVTVGVGKVSPEAERLIRTTEGALLAGIRAAKAGARLGDISWAIQSYAESRGYSVVREYVGHGIGREMHEEPPVPNYGRPGTGIVLRKGMVLAIEPMLVVGDWRTRVLADGWTVVTADGTLAAHAEHTIAITNGEAEILTTLDGGGF